MFVKASLRRTLLADYEVCGAEKVEGEPALPRAVERNYTRLNTSLLRSRYSSESESRQLSSHIVFRRSVPHRLLKNSRQPLFPPHGSRPSRNTHRYFPDSSPCARIRVAPSRTAAFSLNAHLPFHCSRYSRRSTDRLAPRTTTILQPLHFCTPASGIPKFPSVAFPDGYTYGIRRRPS